MTAAVTRPARELPKTFDELAVPRVENELRVLQIFSVLSVGGAETWLMSLLKYFHEQNAGNPIKVTLDVLLTGGTTSVFDDDAREFGARIFYIPFTRSNIPSFVREFRKVLVTGQYDAIHDHQDYIAGLHFLLGLGCLPEVRIAHLHNPLYHRSNYVNGPVRLLAKSAGKLLVGRLATHVMGTSRELVTEYGFDQTSFSNTTRGAAHCGFDVSEYRGNYAEIHADLCDELRWDRSVKVILFVGRLDGAAVVEQGQKRNHKNPELVLDVARECIAKDESVRLVMVGSGVEKRTEFENRVKDWGLDQKIRFLGLRSDVPTLMLGSDLLLFPSLAEGLGMVAVEAQAAGLRVLASDTTPHECVVVPESVEFLSLNAGPSEWARETLRLLKLPRLNSNACNSIVRNSPFSIENSVETLMNIYCQRRTDCLGRPVRA